MPNEVFFLLLLLGVLPILYVAIFVHEMGHAVCGWVAGYRVTSFGMGLGKPLWVFRWGGSRVFFCSTRPLQGITLAIAPQVLPSRRQAALFLSGGVLADLLLLLALLAAIQVLPQGKPYWVLAALINGLMVLADLIPISVRVGGSRMRSDAAQILDMLRGGSKVGQGLSILQTVHALRGFWQSIDDRLFLQVSLMSAATYWFLLGDEDAARRHLDEAMAVPVEPPPAIRALLAVNRGLILSSSDELASAAALTEAETIFRGLEHAFGLFSVREVQAYNRLRRKETVCADRELVELAASPVVARNPSAKLSLLAARLEIACTEDASPLTDALVHEYEAAPRTVRNDIDQLALFRALAEWHRRRGDVAGAVTAYEKALSAAETLHAGLAWSAEAQNGFRQRQEPLLAAARECLLAGGLVKEAERLADRFASSEEVGRRDAEKRRKRNARRVRAGLALLAADVVLTAILCVLLYAGVSTALLDDLVPMLILSIAFAAVVSVPILLGYRFFSSFRNICGPLILFLGILPAILAFLLLLEVLVP